MLGMLGMRPQAPGSWTFFLIRLFVLLSSSGLTEGECHLSRHRALFLSPLSLEVRTNEITQIFLITLGVGVNMSLGYL